MSVTFDPVGRCIYCGSKDENLTREHIFPKGLNGNLILPDASCGKCQAITSAFEGHCLGAIFGKFRARMGYKTSKKNKLKKVQVSLKKSGEICEKEIDVERYSIFLPMPIFPPATLVRPGTKMQPADKIIFGMRYHHNSAEFKSFLLEQEAESIQIETVIKPLQFARMLAKIAHALTVADIGLDTFLPLNIGLILGYENHANYTIGCGWLPEIDPTKKQYSFAKWKFGSLIVIQIRLFSYLGAPSYHVATGMTVSEEIPKSSIERITATRDNQEKIGLSRGVRTIELEEFLKN